MATCPNCAATVQADSRYCSRCGSPVAATCALCGAPLPENVRFCPSCGGVLAAGEHVFEERKLVTVLFSDLMESTALAESLDPENFREVMDLYFSAMRSAIEAEGGTVEKFIGDAIMAAFGVPAAHEDDPTRALRAALRMRRSLDGLNGELAETHGVRLTTRTGINTGQVMAVTRADPVVGMVTGDAVVVAARLEQAADAGQILVGERTVRDSGGFRFREIGALDLKGKRETVKAFELLDVEPGWEARRPALGGPIIGRDWELELLRTLYRRVSADRRSHLVTVFGDPGVGKSRLVEEFCAWATALAEQPAVVSGRCLPYGDGVTYWPLAEILKQRADVLDTDPPEVALAKAHDASRALLTSEVSEDPDRAMAVLCFTVGLEDPQVRLHTTDLRQLRDEVNRAWRAFFSALGRERPTIVVIEDIHWADPAMLELLQAMTGAVEGPVLFLSTARPDPTKRFPAWDSGGGNFSSLLIEPLTMPEAEQLVGFLFPSEHDPTAAVRARILERAGGNPFFLEEIVEHLLEEGARSPAGAEPGPVDIPDTVQGVLAARIDLLSPLDKRVLQSAAVVGKVFWNGPLSRLLGLNGELDDALDRLEERGLVRTRRTSAIAGEHEYGFKHVLTRDVAYESLPRRERAAAHAAVVGWITDRVGERQREFVELLAHHAEQAYRGVADAPGADPAQTERLREGAFVFALQASTEARSKLVIAKAERFAETALSLARSPGERSVALEERGTTKLVDGRGDDAWRDLRDAVRVRVDGDPSDRAAIARLCAKALEIPTRLPGIMRTRPTREEATPLLELGLMSVPDADGQERARLLTIKSQWPYPFGDQVSEAESLEARDAGEEAAAMALRLGRSDLASAALDGVSSHYISRGLYGPVTSVIERRLALAAHLDDPQELGDIYASAAWAHLYLGNYREALDRADEGFRRSSDAPVLAQWCLEWRALARYHLGDWDGFFADHELAATLLSERRDDPPGFVAQRLGVAAYLHEVRGERAAADETLTVLDHLEESGQHPYVPRITWLARVLVRRGTVDDAQRGLETLDGPAAEWARGLVLEAWCELLAESSRWDRAAPMITRARAHAREAGLLALPCWADLLEGKACLAEGDPEAAVDLLEHARIGFGSLGARFEGARAALAEARARSASNDGAGARGLLADAVDVFAALRAVDELAQAREELSSLR